MQLNIIRRCLRLADAAMDFLTSAAAGGASAPRIALASVGSQVLNYPTLSWDMLAYLVAQADQQALVATPDGEIAPIAFDVRAHHIDLMTYHGTLVCIQPGQRRTIDNSLTYEVSVTWDLAGLSAEILESSLIRRWYGAIGFRCESDTVNLFAERPNSPNTSTFRVPLSSNLIDSTALAAEVCSITSRYRPDLPVDPALYRAVTEAGDHVAFLALLDAQEESAS